MPRRKRKRERPKIPEATRLRNEQMLRMLLTSGSLGKPITDAEQLTSLLASREANGFITREWEASKIVAKTHEVVKVLHDYVGEEDMRRNQLLHSMKQEIIRRQTEKLGDKWKTFEVAMIVGENFFVGLAPRMQSPTGAAIAHFRPTPAGGPGPLQAGGMLQVGDVITHVGGTGGHYYAVMAALRQHKAAVSSSSGASMPLNSNAGGHCAAAMMAQHHSHRRMNGGRLLKLRAARYDAPPEHTAETRALCEACVKFAEHSPLVVKYARATRDPEASVWLFNELSVVREILAKLDRKEWLTELLHGKKVPWVLTHCNDPEIRRLIDTYIRVGEVGRGRNKTCLTTAKQVMRMVLKEIKRLKAQEQHQIQMQNQSTAGSGAPPTTVVAMSQ